MRRTLWCLVAGAAFWASGVTAQDDSAAPSDTLIAVRKCARAARISGPALRLDGRLDESAWRAASFVSDFVQKDPNEGAPPREATEVAFLYDDESLWIGARMHSDDPDAIRRLMSRRDQPGNTERIIISLDTYCDRRTAHTRRRPGGSSRSARRRPRA